MEGFGIPNNARTALWDFVKIVNTISIGLKIRKTADCFFQLSLHVNIYLKAETPQATVTTIPFTSTEGSGTDNPIRSIITLLSLTHPRDFLATRII